MVKVQEKFEAWDNPAGLDGFEFLEFTSPTPDVLSGQFESMGFTLVAKHRRKAVTLYRQGGVNFVINAEPGSLAEAFAKEHGPGACAMGFRVQNVKQAYEHALAHGAEAYTGRDVQEGEADMPAIHGIGGSLIYFVDSEDIYDQDFEWLTDKRDNLPGSGLLEIDHLTHNLKRGNMDKWADFYGDIFNFRQIRFFDIEGQVTGLISRALTSPCLKIRIPLNEAKDDQSQIEEFLTDFNGEGIQHIALSTKDIYQTIDSLRDKGLKFLDTPDTYYAMIGERLPEHGEDVAELAKRRILIDGSSDKKQFLLQIFTENMLGPVFFEIIQRKGDQGFGEGNFKALFESIERDQIERGVVTVKE